MSTSPEYEQVLRTVLKWPDDERRSFANEVLTSIGASITGSVPKLTATEARGMLRGKGPAPTDEDVRKIIDEHRMEKYG